MNETVSEGKDVGRFGLSSESRLALDEMVADGFFKDDMACYRLAVSLGIFYKLDISSHKVNDPKGHMYLISQLDPHGIFARVIGDLFPKYENTRYRALERFADLGVIALKEHINKTGSIVFWENPNETTNIPL